jgi:hypothetical protein
MCTIHQRNLQQIDVGYARMIIDRHSLGPSRFFGQQGLELLSQSSDAVHNGIRPMCLVTVSWGMEVMSAHKHTNM